MGAIFYVSPHYKPKFFQKDKEPNIKAQLVSIASLIYWFNSSTKSLPVTWINDPRVQTINELFEIWKVPSDINDLGGPS